MSDVLGWLAVRGTVGQDRDLDLVRCHRADGWTVLVLGADSACVREVARRTARDTVTVAFLVTEGDWSARVFEQGALLAAVDHRGSTGDVGRAAAALGVPEETLSVSPGARAEGFAARLGISFAPPAPRGWARGEVLVVAYPPGVRAAEAEPRLVRVVEVDDAEARVLPSDAEPGEPVVPVRDRDRDRTWRHRITAPEADRLQIQLAGTPLPEPLDRDRRMALGKIFRSTGFSPGRCADLLGRLCAAERAGERLSPREVRNRDTCRRLLVQELAVVRERTVSDVAQWMAGLGFA